MLDNRDLAVPTDRLPDLHTIDFSNAAALTTLNREELKAILSLQETLPLLARIAESCVRELECFIKADITANYKKQVEVLTYLSKLIPDTCLILDNPTQDPILKGYFRALTQEAEKFSVTLSLFNTMGPAFSFTDWKALKHDAIDFKYLLAKLHCFDDVGDVFHRN